MKYLQSWLLYLLEILLRAGARLLKPVQETFELRQNKRFKFEIGDPGSITVFLVGCGGTGSHTAHILAQLADWAKKAGLDMRLNFVDPDTVAEENLGRQNFCRAELGLPKAATLAYRYSMAFEISIRYMVAKFSTRLVQEHLPAPVPGTNRMVLIVGAVDNNWARRDIVQVITDLRAKKLVAKHDRIVWIDAGNERDFGQVVIGSSFEREPVISPMGVCIDLPYPHLQLPGLLTLKNAPKDDLSCAQLSAESAQHAMINRLMATWIGVMLYKLIQAHDLDYSEVNVSMQVGGTSAEYIKGGRISQPALRQRPPAPPQALPPAQANELGGMAIQPVTEGAAAAAPRGALSECPQCGGPIINGTVRVHGVEVRNRFCADEQCGWRQELCPQCRSEITVDAAPDGTPSVVRCTRCQWHQTATLIVPGPEEEEELPEEDEEGRLLLPEDEEELLEEGS